MLCIKLEINQGYTMMHDQPIIDRDDSYTYFGVIETRNCSLQLLH